MLSMNEYIKTRTFSERKEGAGLGLAIPKNILKLHDVEYGVRNTENGVSFYFYLYKK